MKSIKMLGLAALAAMVAMSIVGAGTASATTSLCKVNEKECAEVNRWGKVAVEAKHESPQQSELKTENLTVSCQKSEVKGNITEPQGNPQIIGEITSATWSECGTNEAQDNCEVEALQFPWEAHVVQDGAEKGNGIMYVGNKETSKQPGALIKNKVGAGSNCLTGGISCVYKVKEAQPTHTGEWVAATVNGGNNPTIVFNQVLLKKGSGGSIFCPNVQAFWSSTYHVQTPKPAWVTQQ